MSGVHHCRFRFGQMFIDRHNLITTTSFEPVSPIVLVIKNFASSRAEMCGAGPSPDLRDSMYFFRADGRKNLEQGPALQVTRVRDDAEKHKAAASTASQKFESAFCADISD